VVLVRQDRSSRQAVGAFDYDDLNAYLLLVTNLAYPPTAELSQIQHVLDRASKNEPTPLHDIQYLLGRKAPPAFLDHTDTLTKAVEIFGGGTHRIIVKKHGTPEVVGVLSQLRLLRFFWENMASFRSVFQLHNRTLKELELGSHTVVSIKYVSLPHLSRLRVLTTTTTVETARSRKLCCSCMLKASPLFPSWTTRRTSSETYHMSM